MNPISRYIRKRKAKREKIIEERLILKEKREELEARKHYIVSEMLDSVLSLIEQLGRRR
mgnify:CR=1 FL=1